MSNEFPAYGCPGTVVILDDDPLYLDALARVLPTKWEVRIFSHPATCVEVMRGEALRAESDVAAHHRLLASSNENRLMQILHLWRSAELSRFGRCRAWVMDHAMPAMTGLEASRQVPPFGATRILLTGQADEHTAVEGFNNGLIQQFLPKHSPDLLSKLLAVLERAATCQPEPLIRLWKQELSPQQRKAITCPQAAEALRALVAERGWVEHFLIGQPYGLIALNAEGQAYWVQLETPAGLQELAELARANEETDQTVRAILAGNALYDIELRQALGDGRAGLVEAKPLGATDGLLYGVQALGNLHSPGWRASYGRYRSS